MAHAGGSTAVWVSLYTIEPVFVLGVDPGLSRCGYCVLDASTRRNRAVALGVLRTDPAAPTPQRLAELADDMRALLGEFGPEALAIERVLFQVNASTAMGVGQAAGVIMAESAARGMQVAEYSPNEVKGAVAGFGGADKEQVSKMVQILLELPQPPRPFDAADAAAVALAHVAMTSGRACTGSVL
ncbi:MAG: crossover junction endodeoxyribonuclease RuvC [Actinomycetia bacterium]|nr:crossover junction endodeoxyribonuclease RuvC [Actinomycetes bacterium]